MFGRKTLMFGIVMTSLIAANAFAQDSAAPGASAPATVAEAKWTTYKGTVLADSPAIMQNGSTVISGVCRAAVRDLKNQIFSGSTIPGQCLVSSPIGTNNTPAVMSQILSFKEGTWVKVTGSQVPPNAFEIAKNGDQSIYACRLNYKGEQAGGSVINGLCHHNRSMQKMKDYEILVAPAGTKVVVAEPIFLAGEPRWGAGMVMGITPMGSSARIPMHICRAKMANGEMHAGKEWRGNCYVSFAGKEIATPTAKAETLSYENSKWTPVTGGAIPATAYEMGVADGKPMYICRGKVTNGEVHAGKAWNGTCYIGFAGKELGMPNFEVLDKK
jgi:hypothetical protein